MSRQERYSSIQELRTQPVDPIGTMPDKVTTGVDVCATSEEQNIPAVPPLTSETVFAAFFAPRPPWAVPIEETVSQQTKFQRTVATGYVELTRERIQHDATCAESSDLCPLFGIILLYSDYHAQPALEQELRAGYRYFISGTNTLANEWVSFLDIAPSRILAMVPPEVRSAYEARHGALDIIAGNSFKAHLSQSAQQANGAEGKNSIGAMATNLVQPLHDRTGYQTHPRDQNVPMLNVPSDFQPISQRKRKIPSGACEGAIDPALIADHMGAHRPDLHRSKRARYIVEHEIFQPPYSPFFDWEGKTGVTEEPPPFLRNLGIWEGSAHGSTSLPDMFLPVSSYSDSNYTSTNIPPPPGNFPDQVQAHTDAAQSTAKIKRAPEIAVGQPIYPGDVPVVSNPVPSGSSYPGSQPGRRPNPYAPRKAWVNPHPNAAPGSMTASGGGNRKMAWNPERKRIFTQVEGHLPSELPPAANSPFSNEMFSRTPQSIDPRCCPFEVTVEEMLTYMTGAATINREMCSRIRRHWTASDVVYYVTQAHNLQVDHSYERTKLQHQIRACKETFERNRPGHRQTASLRTCSTESGLVGENSVLHDYYLHAMGDGVANHPQGRAAQMLTRVIQHVRQHTKDRNVLLSQAADYAARHGIVVPPNLKMSNKLDVEDKPPKALITAALKAYERRYGHRA
ncbi:hypothetical protein EK21DRAFT_108184 [Setomelanomma holmii]|uniref:Uncharacterized protein n=1 Tax=Setomelanomma holmii TaxID=210430 RepID=A0A9P4LNQ7_9PLEO|nr:hypothetical protein EK21DRAFT_108184 [Setomelanomma holmii]